MREADEAKFWRQVVRRPDGCWAWTGGRACGSDQVGGMHWQGERLSVRRIAWALAHGAIPERRLLTRCRDASCLNPAHAYEELDVELTERIVADRRPGETVTALARRYGRPRESLSRHLSARARAQGVGSKASTARAR